jgi:hypothetical protein
MHRSSRTRTTARGTTTRGTTARVTAAAALALAGAVAGPLPASAGPADTAPPRVEDITFSRPSVRVSGLDVVPVTVSVRITDASGVEERAEGLDASPQLALGAVPGFQSRLVPSLARTSGTAYDGVWSATVHVPSTWHGTVRVVHVGAADRAGNVLSGRPAVSPALRVTGSHRPAVTIHRASLPGGGFKIYGRAYYTDTGRPLARQALATSYDSGCDLDGGAVNDIVTDARGRYEKRWPAAGPGTAGCVALIRPAAPGQRPTLVAYRLAPAPQESIPDEAMLQPDDLHGATPEPVAGDSWPALRPPQPCTDGPYPGAGLREADRAVQALVGVGERPTVVVAHVATYRDGGAHRYLRELRRAMAACPKPGTHDPRWTVLATGVAGDESMLLEFREYVDYAQTWKSTYVAVARVGRVLVVVADAGWETGSGHQGLVRKLSTRAVSRADVLNQR